MLAIRSGNVPMPLPRHGLWILLDRVRSYAHQRPVGQMALAKAIMDLLWNLGITREELLMRHFMGAHLPCLMGRQPTSNALWQPHAGRELMLDLQNRWGISYMGCSLRERQLCGTESMELGKQDRAKERGMKEETYSAIRRLNPLVLLKP
jgi:hypothetical protein